MDVAAQCDRMDSGTDSWPGCVDGHDAHSTSQSTSRPTEKNAGGTGKTADGGSSLGVSNREAGHRTEGRTQTTSSNRSLDDCREIRTCHGHPASAWTRRGKCS
jgi:hypothetical protein